MAGWSAPVVKLAIEREREREILRQQGPSVGIWRSPQKWHVAPSTGHSSCGVQMAIYPLYNSRVHGLPLPGVCINKGKLG